VRLVGYVAGGLPGQRLLARLAIATSDDTVLRRIRQKPVEAPVPVRNVGVDDWAWRKGQDYGTILANLDLHRVVELLPDRAAESFSQWLQRHPEIATISRDRCSLYAEGTALGAPPSQQIADRFHLVVNLSATMERVLEERSRKLICLRSVRGLPNHSLRRSATPASKRKRRRRNLRSPNCGGNGAWSTTSKWSLYSRQAIHKRQLAAHWDFSARPFAAGSAVDSFQNASRPIGRHRR